MADESRECGFSILEAAIQLETKSTTGVHLRIADLTCSECHRQLPGQRPVIWNGEPDRQLWPIMHSRWLCEVVGRNARRRLKESSLLLRMDGLNIPSCRDSRKGEEIGRARGRNESRGRRTPGCPRCARHCAPSCCCSARP